MKIWSSSILRIYILCVLFAPFFSAGNVGNKINIVVTNTILHDIVNKVIGQKSNLFDVHVIADRHASPHHHMITRHDRIKIIKADLIIANGLNFEQRIQHVIDQVHSKVYYASSSMRHGEVIKYQGIPDPHIWLDPVIWARVVKKIGYIIQVTDKENKNYYAHNTSQLNDKLLSLHKKYQKLFTSSKKNTFIVEHNSYGYLARRYNLNVKYLISANLESGVSFKSIRKIMGYMIQNKNFNILKEAILPSRYLSILKSHMKKLGHDIDSSNILYVDTLAYNGVNSTYYGMMSSNFAKIYKVLNI